MAAKVTTKKKQEIKTATKGEKPSTSSEKAASSAASVKPKKAKETLSLIEPKKKPEKSAGSSSKGKSILPPISKIKAAVAAEKKEKEAASALAKKLKDEKVAKKEETEVLDLITKKKPVRRKKEEEAPSSPDETKSEAAEETSSDQTGASLQNASAEISASKDSEEEAQDVAAEGEESESKIIHIKPPIIIKDLATQMGLRPFEVIRDLMEMSIFAAINQTIEPDIAAKICENHGFVFEKEKREKGAGVHKVEPVIAPPPPPEIEVPEAQLPVRPPIITFMGHVDHGKTSLMDAIRKSRVAVGEAGGITQHLGAYSVQHNGQWITFIDTPGHAAFTAMRARGANVTDIVVLVVAADDGLMPQTLEAISHAKAAGVAIIVAINKVDLATANVDRVKSQLQEQGLVAEDWGGETIVCSVSATKGTGVSELLEMMLLQAEMMELRSSADVDPRCTVIEAQVESGRGHTATVIVRMGTLRTGQAFICGDYWGKVKMMYDDRGKQVKTATPGMPVKVLGFSGSVLAADELLVMESEKAARVLSEERLLTKRTKKLSTPARPTLENLFENMAEGQKKALHIVLKADTQGTLEALVGSLREIPTKKIDLDIIHSGVGAISESDALLASASNAIVVGFNVKVENSANAVAKHEGVQVKLYSIIYELLDQIEEAMAGLLDPETREAILGHAEVKQVFALSKGTVAGCVVVDGRISRTARARVIRRKQVVYDGGITTLRRFKDDVKEVRNGLECGIKLGDYNEYEPGDTIECYQLEKFPQKL